MSLLWSYNVLLIRRVSSSVREFQLWLMEVELVRRLESDTCMPCLCRHDIGHSLSYTPLAVC